MADPILAARRRLAMNAKAARVEAGLTQEQAAEKAECSVMAIRRVEQASAAVTIDFVARLARIYAIDIARLFAETGRWKPARAGRPPTAR